MSHTSLWYTVGCTIARSRVASFPGSPSFKYMYDLLPCPKKSGGRAWETHVINVMCKVLSIPIDDSCAMQTAALYIYRLIFL